jgi:hypothetical protein
MLSANDQEIADRVFKESEAATKAEGSEPINKALTALERIAAQLTSAMMNPGDGTTNAADNPPNEFTKF